MKEAKEYEQRRKQLKAKKQEMEKYRKYLEEFFDGDEAVIDEVMRREFGKDYDKSN